VQFSDDAHDYWRLPAFVLWLAFFAVGLLPEPAYLGLRELAGVLPQRALVNSARMITVMMAAYVAVFASNRCIQSGLSQAGAQDRALQIGIIALAAFLPIDFLTLFTLHANPLAQDKTLNYAAGGIKVLAWWYLLSLFLRYYLLGQEDAFARMRSLFPSSRHRATIGVSIPTTPTHDASTEMNEREISVAGKHNGGSGD